MNKTAMQWFVDQLPIRILNAYADEIQKALEMEKTQIQTAYDKGYNESWEEIQNNIDNNINDL